jgi:hypothetical protein
MNIAQIFQFVLFLYEYIVWHFEIPGLCNHNHHTNHNLYMMNASINSFMHLFGFFAFRSQRKVLQVIYTLILTFFVFMQCMFWWFPYLGFTSMSMFHRKEGGLVNYDKHFADKIRIIPRGWSEIHPSLEHTILFPLSVIALATTLRQLVNNFKKNKQQ